MAEVGVATNVGSRYGPELNQDWGAAEKLDKHSNHYWVGLVLDGHGMLGEVSAEVGGTHMMKELHGKLDGEQPRDLPKEDVEEALKAAFLSAHAKCLELYESAPEEYEYPKASEYAETYTLGKDMFNHPVYSTEDGERLLEFGATATAAVLRRDELCVAQCGDSACVVGRQGEEGKPEGAVVFEKHTGESAAERERLERDFPKLISIDDDDGYVSAATGPWAGSELAMTRCLGHRMLSTCGVVPDPEVIHIDLSEGGRALCVVLASDGVWDYMEPGEVVRFVMDLAEQGRTGNECAQALVENAVNVAESSDGSADNTTAVVFLV